jgi:hypothetical protein
MGIVSRSSDPKISFGKLLARPRKSLPSFDPTSIYKPPTSKPEPQPSSLRSRLICHGRNGSREHIAILSSYFTAGQFKD